jgi:hypothetical protein
VIKAGKIDHTWTMTQAFYATMGGFVLSAKESEPFLTEDSTKNTMTLTVYGLEFIAENYPHLLPSLTEDEIQDKSKASSFAKAIVCAQAAWFLLQCVSRKADSLPVTLLEASQSSYGKENTFANCLDVA